MAPQPSFRTHALVAATAARWFAENFDDGGARAAVAALDLQSPAMREVIARMFDPDADYPTIINRVVDLRHGSLGVDKHRAGLLCALARAVGLQRSSTEDVGHALALYRAARCDLPLAEWPAVDLRTFAQLLWVNGELDALRADAGLLSALPSAVRDFVEIDLEGVVSGVGSTAWLRRLNSYLTSREVAPIALAPNGLTPFDRLRPVASGAAAYGPLITVIMPAYQPGREILTAVRSILEQTWQDWELVVVDDASGSKFDVIFEEIDNIDSRVNVYRQSINRGAYAARNLGLKHAGGEFVTFQDIDDWSHPERLEQQVRPLLEDSALLRTFSLSIRSREDLCFHYLGYSPIHANASSHMFRRSVLDKVGRFDWVRKGADTEFDRRLEAVHPGRRQLVRRPLAFVRLQDGSLSRGDTVPGWMHPARVEYHASMLHWHRQIEAGASPAIPADAAQRPLSAPRAFLRDTGVPSEPVDIAFIADWTADSAVQRAGIDEMRTLSRSGLRVGLIHVRSVFSEARRRAPLGIAARRALADGVVTYVSVEEEDHVPTLVVRQPEILAFPSSRPVRLTSDRVIVVAESVPEAASDAGSRWVVDDCDRHATLLFGQPPVWLVGDEKSHEAVARRLGQGRISSEEFPVVFDLDSWRYHGPRAFQSVRPVIGWVAGSEISSFPFDTADLLKAFPLDGSADVRILGGRRALRRLLGNIPAAWVVYDSGEISSRELMQQVDFVAAFPAVGPTHDTLRTVYEALVTGCVAVVDHSFKQHFGDAVVTCTPDEAPAVIASLRNDPVSLRSQARRGRQWAVDRFGGSSATLAAALDVAIDPRGGERST